MNKDKKTKNAFYLFSYITGIQIVIYNYNVTETDGKENKQTNK